MKEVGKCLRPTRTGCTGLYFPVLQEGAVRNQSSKVALPKRNKMKVVTILEVLLFSYKMAIKADNTPKMEQKGFCFSVCALVIRHTHSEQYLSSKFNSAFNKLKHP